jgi:hypothetical protein
MAPINMRFDLNGDKFMKRRKFLKDSDFTGYLNTAFLKSSLNTNMSRVIHTDGILNI